ncbi:GNAT family N-acetyltransferase [Candidatus Shapirobacteria bacterium]|nr:GNAT family N-acetyltransferase [Candidatus Shapirobacteria bacterium]
MALELLSAKNCQQVVDFYHRQFKQINRWCNLEELLPRLRSQVSPEVIGVIDKEENVVVGAVIAYRNSFSFDQWTIPVIAVDKGTIDGQLPSVRRQGRGKKLMESVYKEIQRHGGKSVLADTNIDPDKGGSREFLEASGLKFLCEIPGYFDGSVDEVGLLFIRHL